MINPVKSFVTHGPLASSLLDKNKVESEQTVETKQTKVDTRRN